MPLITGSAISNWGSTTYVSNWGLAGDTYFSPAFLGAERSPFFFFNSEGSSLSIYSDFTLRGTKECFTCLARV